MCGFQLFIGRIYTFYNPKIVYISCLGIFELGSLICGAAPNSVTLIVGRAIAGLGSSGMFSGAITIIVYIVPLQKRPAYTGLFGAVFAIASVAGPLLGGGHPLSNCPFVSDADSQVGVFTDKLSWRWCFYINLPIGGAVMILLFFVLHLPPTVGQGSKGSLKENIRRLDPIGTAILLPAVVCLLLALQWGGTKYSWDNGRIIALLVLSGVLFVIFIYLQHLFQENATIPPRILKYRAVTAGVSYAFFGGAGMMTLVYFLPIWFQAIKGASAVHSGIMNLPAVLGITVASIVAGFLTRKIGYFTQWMCASCVLGSIGVGLISTFTTTTAHPKWIGYQFLWGFGLGLGMQQPSVGAQVSLPRKDVPTGASMMFFAQALGGSIFVSVANNVFDNALFQNLKKIPGIDANVVTHVGATDLRKQIPENLLGPVLVAYNQALRSAFYVVLAVTCCTAIGALSMPWLNLKKVAAAQQAAAKAAKEKAASEASGSKPGSPQGGEVTGHPLDQGDDEKRIEEV